MFALVSVRLFSVQLLHKKHKKMSSKVYYKEKKKVKEKTSYSLISMAKDGWK